MTHYPRTTAERDRVFNRAVEHIRAATERQYRLITQAEPAFKMTHYTCNGGCIFCPHPALLFKQRKQYYVRPDRAFFVREKLKTYPLCKDKLKALKALEPYENKLRSFASAAQEVGSEVSISSSQLRPLLHKIDSELGTFTLLPYLNLELMKRDIDANYRVLTERILDYHKDHTVLKDPCKSRNKKAMLTIRIRPRLMFPNQAGWSIMIYVAGRKTGFFRDSFLGTRKDSGGAIDRQNHLFCIPKNGPTEAYLKKINLSEMWPIIEVVIPIHEQLQARIARLIPLYEDAVKLSQMAVRNAVVGGVSKIA